MLAIQKRSNDGKEDNERRNRLLAILHIAKDELNFSERFYRDLLDVNFRVPTAAALSVDELSRLIKFIMDEYDWRPKGYKGTKKRSAQAEMLRKRVLEFIPQIPEGENRIKGLCRKLCNTDRVEWCHDADKLKRLLAALGNIKRREAFN